MYAYHLGCGFISVRMVVMLSATSKISELIFSYTTLFFYLSEKALASILFKAYLTSIILPSRNVFVDWHSDVLTVIFYNKALFFYSMSLLNDNLRAYIFCY